MNFSLLPTPFSPLHAKRNQGAYAPRSPRAYAPGSARAVGARLTGFTLIEMLVAVAITMIMMLAIAQLFLYLGDNMDKGRAIIEMSGQLRNVSHRLQEDLDGLTASTLPWTKPDAGDGYFEYIEGTGTDAATVTTMRGDGDDLLAFTARSKGRPFVGRHGVNVIESELAEIIWWASAADAVGVRTLHRRVLLIRPDLTPAAADDISQRVVGGNRIANSLADLTLRQNRTLHASGFPHEMDTSGLTPDATGRETVLSNVVAFDVKAWDPLAPVRSGTLSALVPGDPGWAAATTTVGRGAYVDLGYAGVRTTSFYSGAANANSGLTTTPTYSTWPYFYEQDGIDQDSDSVVDEGTDGFNNSGANAGNSAAADDSGEYETTPPYPHPAPFTGVSPDPKAPGLRGIQVRIRLTELGSRQVRQSTVVAEFLPE